MSDATHVHVHAEHHARQAEASPRLSLLTMSAGWRVGGAALVVVVIWAAVLWALRA